MPDLDQRTIVPGGSRDVGEFAFEPLDDLRIVSVSEIPPPVQLREQLPLDAAAQNAVRRGRSQIRAVLGGFDSRLLVVVGPCSVHDTDAAREYAQRLAECARRYADELLIAMRVYFEKPRTTVGWKGLINDPDLDGSCRIGEGLATARALLLDVARLGLPAATEFLDPITPEYIVDLISWGAIGARTVESQVHRQVASALSCPVGFKNGSSGDIAVAVEAVLSARNAHQFLSHTREGRTAIVLTSGNPDCHIVLRGGKNGPNHSADHLVEAGRLLREAGLPERLMVDCSHANSSKDHRRQGEVCEQLAVRIAQGDMRMMGLMIESHLVEGRQELGDGCHLRHGQSITDACIGWEQTERLLARLHEAAGARRCRLAVRSKLPV
ncbi:3-deoxy-7-phosphoheptulonate synthase [Gloeobacter morelensis]|uniref:3-deoxy-7-phosphoheptulonate synthase n=1 Tax=Gloeobacter morelensis TaxID=2907343 RepID=UPI001E5A8A95|nr:3-deoxy-7-phosphoheptulonate synthase [Gloeobacter morelensis]